MNKQWQHHTNTTWLLSQWLEYHWRVWHHRLRRHRCPYTQLNRTQHVEEIRSICGNLHRSKWKCSTGCKVHSFIEQLQNPKSMRSAVVVVLPFGSGSSLKQRTKKKKKVCFEMAFLFRMCIFRHLAPATNACTYLCHTAKWLKSMTLHWISSEMGLCACSSHHSCSTAED